MASSDPLSTSVDRSADDARCTGCGLPLSECAGCRRDLDPPRFCPRCGRRLRVVVSPAGYRADCREHGELVEG